MCCQAYITYEESVQNEWYYYPSGILLSAVGFSLWLYVAKMTTGKETFIAAVIWDSMAAFAFFVLPLLIFNVKLNTLNIMGLTLGVVGIILMKMGG